MSEPNVIREQHGRVLLLTLNRPDLRNALAAELVTELVEGLTYGRDEASVGALVVTGSGNSFCAGANIRAFNTQAEAKDVSAMRTAANLSVSIYEVIRTLGKPLIGAVNGYAVGGGCGLVSGMDMAFASEKAIFGYPEITRGFVPAIVTALAHRVFSRKHLFELMLGGDRFDAQRARAMGLVNWVVPHEELIPQALAYADKLAGYSPSAMKLIRDLIFQMDDMEYSKALQTGRDMSSFMRLGSDFAAGASAFLNKTGHKATLEDK